MPDELAERHVGWRLIEVFVARDLGDLLFWSVAFARYEGAGAAEILSKVVSATTVEHHRAANQRPAVAWKPSSVYEDCA